MYALPPLDPQFEMVVSSRGMSKGIEQADEPQVIPKAFVEIGDAQFGGQWKNVTSSTGTGEASAFVNASRDFGHFSFTIGAAYKVQTGAVPGADTDSLELSTAVSRRCGRLWLGLNAFYSRDDLGERRSSLYVEGGPAFALTKTLRVSANLGTRTRTHGPDYIAGNIGITKTLAGHLGMDLRLYQTNRHDLSDIYRRRVVIAGRWAF
jgi:hypothetical protein